MIAYLSGAMEYAGDEGAGWRKSMSEWLDMNLAHSVVDPVVESGKMIEREQGQGYRSWKAANPGKFVNFVRKLVNHDIDCLTKNTDYVICLWNEDVFKGAGTHGEVTLAYHYNLPVYLVNKVPFDDLSGWIQACSTEIFPDFESLQAFLLEKYGKQ